LGYKVYWFFGPDPSWPKIDINASYRGLYEVTIKCNYHAYWGPLAAIGGYLIQTVLYDGEEVICMTFHRMGWVS
ncbi:MAG: hypothetical protein ACMUHM_08710, partial [Thermoplasmatota archaeon]